MLENLIKAIGIDDATIERVKSLTSEDEVSAVATEYLGTQKNIFLQSPDVEDTFKSKYGNMAIGKEKQLKKDAARHFGLTLTQSELDNLKFDEILAKGRAAIAAPDNKELDDLKSKYNSLLDATELQKTEYEAKIDEIRNSIDKERLSQKINNDFEQFIVATCNINAKNVKIAARTIAAGIKEVYGADIGIDDKNALQLYKDGNIFVKDNKKVHLRDVVTEIYGEIAGEGFTRRHDNRTPPTDKKLEGRALEISERNRRSLERSGLA